MGRDELASLAAILPTLEGQALGLLRRRVPGPLHTYLLILADACSIDVAAPEAAAFQRRFNGFYGVRRNAQWRGHFYQLFQDAMGWGNNPRALFSRALTTLELQTGRVEASFVSKLVASLHPKAPIIDSIVRLFLAKHLPAPNFGGGVEAALAYYRWLDEVMAALAATPEALGWSAAFDQAFADIPGASTIHSVKRLDFLIWAGSRS